jgi:cyclophilin family peptidyl-prolyl cis-trans isomerase/protein-disulfide isomerase
MTSDDDPRVPSRAARRVTLYGPALLLVAGLLAAGCASTPSTPSTPPTQWTPIALNPVAPAGTPRPPTVAAPAGTLLPTLALIAPITEADWTRGPAEAPITLLLYSDFHCKACADLALVLDRLQTLHSDDIRVVFRDFPLLTLRDKSALAAQAAASADEQGRFWEMHDLLFARYDEWSVLSPEQFSSWLVRAAPDAGVDAATLSSDLQTRRFEPSVADAYNQAVASGIPGAPYLFFNRDLFMLPLTLEYLEARVRLKLLEGRQFTAYPPMSLVPGADYRARLRLNSGEIVLDLYEDSAPLAVNSFVFLAENDWFDGTPFYRVVRGQYVEAGDPSGTGFGTPGYAYGLETTPARTFDRPGVVGVASDDPSAFGSRFFISLAPLPLFDPARTVLGQVTSGLDRLDALAARDPLTDLLLDPEAVILDVIIEVR